MTKQHTFFDDVIREPGIEDFVKESLPQAVVVNCDEVSEYYWQGTTQEYWSMKDFPNVAPPYESFWLDFHAPRQVTSDTRGTYSWSSSMPTRWGFYCQGVKLSDVKNLTEYLDLTSPEEIEPFYGRNLERLKWGIDMYLFLDFQGKIRSNVWLWRVLVEEDGSNGKHSETGVDLVASQPGKFGREMIESTYRGMQEVRAYNAHVLTALPGFREVLDAYGISPNSLMNEDIENLLREPQDDKEVFEKARLTTEEGLRAYLHTALLSLSFLHCRNIGLEEVKPALQVPHTKAQKRRGEKPFQPVTHKVLNIWPMREILDKKQREKGVGTARAMHFCRGHFVHYKDGRGLFGREKGGTYFRPFHARGNKQAGTIEKQYKVKVKG
jgi:hypothetical protein